MNLTEVKFEYLLLAFAVIYFVYKEFIKNKAPKEEREKPEGTPEKRPSFLELWPDFLTIPGILSLVALGIYALDYFSPADSVRWFGGEKIQALLYGVGAFFIISLLAFLWLRINFPGVFKFYSREGFRGAFDKLTPFQKWLVFLFALSLPFFSLVSLFQIV